MLIILNKKKKVDPVYRSNSTLLTNVNMLMPFTVQGYFKLDTSGTNHFNSNIISCLLSLGRYYNLNSSDSGLHQASIIYFNGKLRLTFNYYSISDYGTSGTDICTMVTGVNYHIAVEVSAGQLVRVYVNGVLQLTRTFYDIIVPYYSYYFDGSNIGLQVDNSAFYGWFNTVTKFSVKAGLTYNGVNFTPI